MLGPSEIGDFLRSRRAALSPQEVGLTSQGHRKVAGLRREEVAMLAGMSTDYYTRLEQGRLRSASESVLVALAEALRLDDAERLYLMNLTRPASARRRGAGTRTAQQAVSPETQRMLDGFVDQPAFVLGRRQAVLAGNHLAYALLTDFRRLPPAERNLLRWIVLAPAPRSLYLDWADIAADVTGVLRAEAAKYPEDATTAQLVGELTVKSEEFSHWWSQRAVRGRGTGSKRFNHPVVGRVDIDWSAFPVPDTADQTLFIYTAPTQRDLEALRMLGSWSAAAAGEAPGSDGPQTVRAELDVNDTVQRSD